MVRSHAAGLSRHGAALCILYGLAATVLGGDLPLSGDVPPPPGTTVNLIDFDLQAQPLASALNKYADVSHRSVMFRDALVSGRISSPVQGRYTPQMALRVLLSGTGLAVDEADAQLDKMDAFVLKLAPSNIPAPADPDRHYDGVVQARVWEAFCADPRTAPGNYRAVLRFHVDAAGHIQQANLLVSTGDGPRDAAMLAVLDTLRFEQPPQDLVQPLTLVILPRNAIADHPDCKTVH